MTRRDIALALLARPLLAAFAKGQSMDDVGSGQAAAPHLACDSHAFDPTERARWKQLGERIVRSARATRELPAGYALDFARGRETLAELAEFVELESRCCPFLDFSIRVASGRGTVSLELTGGEGVKEFLEAELKLAR